MKDKVFDPLNDYQLLQESTTGGSYFFANVDTFGVEQTMTLENTAKPYVVNEETGEPGVVSGKPVNAVPRDDNDKQSYDDTSDVYYDPEYTYTIEQAEDDSQAESGDTATNA